MASHLASDEEYSAALVENVRLEKEVDALKAMVAHMQSSVSSERSGFQEQWEALSAEALKLKKEHDALHAKLEESERHNAAQQAEHAEQRERWAAQLDMAAREFETMREQLIPPAELEAMRLRIVEEAARPWRARVAELEAGLQAVRAEATSARREAEKHRAAHETLELEHSAALREAESRHETMVAEMRAKLDMALVEESSRGEPLERMRKLQRENKDLNARVERLLEEVDDLRAESDALRSARDALAASQARREGEDRANARLAQAERESLERRISHLTGELETASSANERLHETNLRQEADMRSLRAAVDDAQHALMSEQAANASRAADVSRELEKLKLEMERRHAEAGRREEVLQRSRDEVSVQLMNAQREASLELTRARDDAATRIRRLEAERADLQEDLAKAHSDAAAAAAVERDRLQAAQGEIASLKAELHGAVLAKESAVDESSRHRRRFDEADGRHHAATAELTAVRKELASATARMVSLQEREADAAARHDKLAMQLEVATREHARVRAEAGATQMALVAKVKAAKRAWAKERQQLRQAESARARQVSSLRSELEHLRIRYGVPAGISTSEFKSFDPSLAANAPVSQSDYEGLVRDEEAVQAEIAQIKKHLLASI